VTPESTIKLSTAAKPSTEHLKELQLGISWYFTCIQTPATLEKVSGATRSSKPEQAFVAVVSAVM
jgi:hypothetical protein